MSPLWTIPAVAGLAGLLAVIVVARQVADGLTQLAGSVRRAHEVRIALSRVTAEIRDFGATVGALRHR